LPVQVRVAGALVLLYGITVTRVVTLTAGALTRSRNSTFLTLDRKPVLLPRCLAQLIDELLTVPAPGSATVAVEAGDARPLFPGRIPTATRSAVSLVRHLNYHGIHARPARNSALITLAADLPAAVLADITGMHPKTAACWAQLSQGDWAAYLRVAPGFQAKQR
jgi:hypothetical protein